MRVAVLWTELSGYMSACLKALAESDDVELFVAHIAVTEVPFGEMIFSWMENRYGWEAPLDTDKLIALLDSFSPDVILCSNWHIRGYRKALKHFRGKAVRILASDRPWFGGVRQWLGALISPFYLRPICEALFIAGERQAVFARKMGFNENGLLRGLYSCDHRRFAETYVKRCDLLSEPRAFVFIGRFLPEKGIDILVDGYRRYRESVEDPWSLKCYGSGPLLSLLDDIDGIECFGFCQPEDLPDELLKYSCLILPSVFEPWALVVHEAASAGLATIVSNAVGASVHLVQDGYNGYIVDTGSAAQLAQAMLRYTSLSRTERNAMAENSYRMSLQFTPERWASTLVTAGLELKELKSRRR